MTAVLSSGLFNTGSRIREITIARFAGRKIVSRRIEETLRTDCAFRTLPNFYRSETRLWAADQGKPGEANLAGGRDRNAGSTRLRNRRTTSLYPVV